MWKVFLITILLQPGGSITREVDMGAIEPTPSINTEICSKMADRLNVMPAEPPYLTSYSYCEERIVKND